MRTLIFILLLMSSVFSQTPPIEPGVSHELAKWRAAHYSDVRYKLGLTLEKMSPVLKGTMEIRVNVRDAVIVVDWRKIRGHEDKSNISNVSINGRVLSPAFRRPAAVMPKATGNEGRPPEGGTQNTYEESNEHLIFRDGVVAGENVIKLDFTSPILTSGSAITRYVDKEDGAEYIYSLFVPSDASTAFPVFDQPDLKARFTLTMTVPGLWRVVSNSTFPDEKKALYKRWLSNTVIGTSVLEGKYTQEFVETKPISTYVFAFAAGPWQQVSEPGAVATGGVGADKLGSQTSAKKSPVATAPGSDSGRHIYVRKSQLPKFQPHAAEVFRLNLEGIKFLETYFDYKFPFPKYDIVLIPEFPFGGMEHAGATFLRESSVIFPQEPTKNDYISRANVIFHEAAHQWFGDTVTMKWFDDLWLKEGFAEFMAYKTLEKVMPEYNAWKVFYERNKQAAYLTDSTKGTTPIYQEIKNLSAAKSAYGNIVYRKAPSFLKQAEFYIGPDKFQTAVRSFLKKYEFGNAGWEDLVKEFETASTQDLKVWAAAWVRERGLSKVDGVSGQVGGSFRQHGVVVSNALGEKAAWKMKTRSIIFLRNRTTNMLETEIREIELGNERVGNQLYTGIYREHSWSNKGVVAYFANYQDYGYGIFLLDDKSRDYVLKNIQNEKDDFLRSMMWGSLWDSVREGELDPKEYVELVVKVLSSDVQSPSVQSPAFRRPASIIPNAAGNEGRPPKGGTQNEVKRPPEGGTQNEVKKPPKGGTQNEVKKPPEGGTQNEVKKPPEGGTQNEVKKPPEGGTLNGETPDGETDESTIATLLGRVSTAMTYYLSDAQRNAIAPNLEAILIEKMRTAPTLGQRITFYRALLNVASTENARKVLKEMLASAGGNPTGREGVSSSTSKNTLPTGRVSASLTDLPLKTKDRFDIVTRLLILNDPDAPKLLADLEKTETSDEAKRYAYAAKAGIATVENKVKFWSDFTTNKDISESWIEAAFGPFNSVRHADLTLPYLDRALKELPNHKRNRKIFFINGWLGAFIGGQRSEEALAVVNKFLADNPDLDRDLRLKILENVDLIERAVKIRKAFAAVPPDER